MDGARGGIEKDRDRESASHEDKDQHDEHDTKSCSSITNSAFTASGRSPPSVC